MHYCLCVCVCESDCIGFWHLYIKYDPCFLHSLSMNRCVCLCLCISPATMKWKFIENLASYKMKMSWIYSLRWILNCILGINATQWFIRSTTEAMNDEQESRRERERIVRPNKWTYSALRARSARRGKLIL